jgi:hypothetical protein
MTTPGESAVHTALIRGETFDYRPVQYAVVDGRAVFEGDIVLGLDEDLQRDTAAIHEEAVKRVAGLTGAPGDVVDPSGGPVFEAAVVVTGSSRRWPGGVVPYEIDPGLTAAARSAVQQAVSHWNDTTRLSVRPRRDSDTDWMRFIDADEDARAARRTSE